MEWPEKVSRVELLWKTSGTQLLRGGKLGLIRLPWNSLPCHLPRGWRLGCTTHQEFPSCDLGVLLQCLLGTRGSWGRAAPAPWGAQVRQSPGTTISCSQSWPQGGYLRGRFLRLLLGLTPGLWGRDICRKDGKEGTRQARCSITWGLRPESWPEHENQRKFSACSRPAF